MILIDCSIWTLFTIVISLYILYHYFLYDILYRYYYTNDKQQLLNREYLQGKVIWITGASSGIGEGK